MKKTKNTITSLELPNDVHYMLTKVKANKDSPFIQEGATVIGRLTSNPILLGERCSVVRSINDAIYTSNVTKIKLKKGSTKIILTTENSVYELEEV